MMSKLQGALLGWFGLATVDVGRVAQIGRASCRERV